LFLTFSIDMCSLLYNFQFLALIILKFGENQWDPSSWSLILVFGISHLGPVTMGANMAWP
jgi:hypothetical protein